MKKFISIFVLVSLIFSSVQVNAAFWNALPEFKELYEAKNFDKLNELIMLDERDKVTSTATIQVNIDETNITGNRNDRLFGVGTEAFSGMERYVDITTGELLPGWKALAKEMYKIPVVRFGGHSANKVNALSLVGPLSQRTKASVQDNIDIENFYLEYGKESLTTESPELNIMGTAEYMKVFLENNPDIEFVWTVSVTHAQPEDSANFVRFCLDDANESEWGALRAQYVREEPLNLSCVELGNELYANPYYSDEINDSKRKWYVDICIKHIEAIREYYPDLDISAVICSNGHDPATDANGFGFRHWNPYIIEQLGQYIDVFSFHLYHSGYEFDHIGPWVFDTEDYFEQFFGPDHGKKLAITEGSKWSTDNYAGHTMESALATCQYLNWWNERINLLYCYTYFTFTQTNWAIPVQTEEGNWTESAVAKMFKLYTENMGDRIVSSSLDWTEQIALEETGQEVYNKSHFSASVSAKDDDTLVVIMSNREPYIEMDAHFNFNNKYTLVEETVYRANNQKSMIKFDKNKDAFHITTNKKNESDFRSYTVPNESMVILTLKSDKKIPKYGESEISSDEAVYSGENNFADIQHHWASNEINILASEGVVSGDSNGKFNPNDYITRAEFSALLCKALGMNTDANKKVFNDVNVNDWYSKYIVSAWSNGYIRGGSANKFMPNNYLSTKDVTQILYRVCCSKTLDTQVEDAQAYIVASQLDKKIDDLHSWNAEALVYVMKNGLINKFYETDNYNPKDSVTRAEAAVMIYRLRNLIGM